MRAILQLRAWLLLEQTALLGGSHSGIDQVQDHFPERGLGFSHVSVPFC